MEEKPPLIGHPPCPFSGQKKAKKRRNNYKSVEPQLRKNLQILCETRRLGLSIDG
jgi:hypothetical protein